MWLFLFKGHCLGNSAAGRHSLDTQPCLWVLLSFVWNGDGSKGSQGKRWRQELASRNPWLALNLHLPGQATSGGNRLFFRHICIFGGFISTKDSLNLLQWPREGSTNQQLVKVGACGGGETQNENTAWQWWQGSDKKVNWSILLFTFYKLLSVSLLGLWLTQCLHCDGWRGQEHMSSLCF